jgi:hypothetical protein
MGRQERMIDGTEYIRLAMAEEMLAPLNRVEAIKLMKEQGVWPTAVRTVEGFSPDTCGKCPNLWVESAEIENLVRIFSKN